MRDCTSALNEALRLLGLLPCSDGADYRRFVGELRGRFAGNPKLAHTRDALMDCTEIKVQHPEDKGEQKDKYSGKKKTHTIKKLIISLFCGYIVFASHKFDGSVADKKASISRRALIYGRI